MKDRYAPVILRDGLLAGDGAALALPFTCGQAAFLGHLPGNVFSAPVFVGGECTSTFEIAWELAARRDLPPWSAVLAVCQTQGRGQLRRSWESPPGNLYVSFMLPPDFLPLDTLASLAVGYCIHAALAAMGIDTRLKWPNDLLLVENGMEGKVGGLLLEERGGRLVAGLGLNLRHAPDAGILRKQHAVPAVAMSGFDGPVVVFWQQLAEGMREVHGRDIVDAGSAVLREKIESALAWRGRRIHAEDEGITGELVGIAPDGALRVGTASGCREVSSGSIYPV